jgi:uncharacterized membrane protein YoaK (UPF0700 family)
MIKRKNINLALKVISLIAFGVLNSYFYYLIEKKYADEISEVFWALLFSLLIIIILIEKKNKKELKFTLFYLFFYY